MNRVVINMDAQGCFTVYSDEPIELFTVSDHTPNDRVYQMMPVVGVQEVRAQLGNDPVGHIDDDMLIGGTGYGRKPPAERKLKVVEPESKVIELPVITSLEGNPDRALEFAIGKFGQGVVIVGYDDDGDFNFKSSIPDGANVLWLLKMAEKKLLEVEL